MPPRTATSRVTQGPDKVARFAAALDHLIERVREDRYILAVVQVGSLSPDTIWERDPLEGLARDGQLSAYTRS